MIINEHFQISPTGSLAVADVEGGQAVCCLPGDAAAPGGKREKGGGQAGAGRNRWEGGGWRDFSRFTKFTEIKKEEYQNDRRICSLKVSNVEVMCHVIFNDKIRVTRSWCKYGLTRKSSKVK